MHAACFQDRWSAAAFAGLLSTPGTFALIASVGGEPAGFVVVRVAADEAEILTLGVVPDWRRRKIGTALLHAAGTDSHKAGARRLFLEVAEDNPAARGLYGAAGFEAAGRRPGYYRRANGRPAAALILVRAPTSESERQNKDFCAFDQDS
jgi:ribosomal-protein-alanine N-acetyltransferase